MTTISTPTGPIVLGDDHREAIKHAAWTLAGGLDVEPGDLTDPDALYRHAERARTLGDLYRAAETGELPRELARTAKDAAETGAAPAGPWPTAAADAREARSHAELRGDVSDLAEWDAQIADYDAKAAALRDLAAVLALELGA